MSIYDIDFTRQGQELQSPDKRGLTNIALIAALLKAVQWCRDLLFTSYKTGSTAPPYATGLYNQFHQVIYQKSVYYSLIDNNTDLPTANTWLKVQDNFLGVDERVHFNGQRIVLEYALNQQFGGTFRPMGSSSLSDIYITNIDAVTSGYRIGQTEAATSSTGKKISSDNVGLRYPFVQLTNFKINIKSSVYQLTNQQAIKDFVNQYIPISLNFIIQSY